jgi:ankyrin repeat protein
MPALVKALLSQRADPNAQIVKSFPGNARSPYDPSPTLPGATPFLLASAAANVDIMRILLDSGADPQIKSKDGSTPLMVAAGVGRVDDRPAKDQANALEAVKLAASLGNDVNAANERGRTALHGAAGGGANAIVQFLADHGANLNAKDRRGNTPVEIALGMGTFAGGLPAGRIYKSTADLLLKLGAQPPQMTQQPAVGGTR